MPHFIETLDAHLAELVLKLQSGDVPLFLFLNKCDRIITNIRNVVQYVIGHSFPAIERF